MTTDTTADVTHASAAREVMDEEIFATKVPIDEETSHSGDATDRTVEIETFRVKEEETEGPKAERTERIIEDASLTPEKDVTDLRRHDTACVKKTGSRKTPRPPFLRTRNKDKEGG